MKIDIKKVLNIPGEEEKFSVSLSLSWVKRLGETIFPESLAVEGNIKNHAGIVELRYQINGVMMFRCDRCLMQTKKEINESFSHSVVNHLEDTSLDDVYVIANDGLLDIEAIVADDLLLQLPQVLLCKEDCLGLNQYL